MYKHKEYKVIRVTALIMLKIITAYENFTAYFKREVTVYVNYIHDNEGRHPYTVNGYVVRKGTAHSFTGIPWEDVDMIIEKLHEDDEPMIFEVTHCGWYQEIFLPKWAKMMFADKLIELKAEHNNT